MLPRRGMCTAIDVRVSRFFEQNLQLDVSIMQLEFGLCRRLEFRRLSYLAALPISGYFAPVRCRVPRIVLLQG